MNIMDKQNTATAEMVGRGHPDKACDQLGDSLLDGFVSAAKKLNEDPTRLRTAIEVLTKDNMVVVSGEIRASDEVIANVDVEQITKTLWKDIGYDSADRLAVQNCLHKQSPEIATMIDDGGAGDQGIMVGSAFRDTPDMMPREYVLSRDIIMRLDTLARNGSMPFIKSDCKSQVSVNGAGQIKSVIVSTQHTNDISLDELRADILEKVIIPVVGDINPLIAKINHKGSFIVGGPEADAGVLGRKIVVDAYGPRTPVGGGAYSGKDATKVDRSAAYQARQIAKTALIDGFDDAKSCVVTLSYGIGQHQPEAVTAMLDGTRDISDWVRARFKDLSPKAIQERLGLWECDGWNYAETASFGHYGRSQFPWEKTFKS